MTRRVVVTGIGLASPIGNSVDEVSRSLREGRPGVVRMDAWDSIGDLATRVGGVVADLDLDGRWPRRMARSMGRVAKLAAYASDAALADAGLDPEELRSGDVGLAYGSTHGSSSELEAFCRRLFTENRLDTMSSATYLRYMTNTCAANLAQLYGIRGRVQSTCAACVSSSQAIGAGYEAIRSGAQEVMICGGAEELHYLAAGTFDVLQATSTRYNTAPERTPRPFDVDRDGLVVAEGSATVVLESEEHARARSARVLAVVLGYGTNCDGTHVTAPSVEGMAGCMKLALRDAGLSPREVGYVNAHATATVVGDIAESEATREVMGEEVPVSSTKGLVGHTLGACGALETIFCIAVLRDGFLPATRNLDRVDPKCAPLAYLTGAAREARVDVVLNNNFAFGGINTSLLLGRA